MFPNVPLDVLAVMAKRHRHHQLFVAGDGKGRRSDRDHTGVRSVSPGNHPLHRIIMAMGEIQQVAQETADPVTRIGAESVGKTQDTARNAINAVHG
jgi:hypothetical protein